MPHNTTIALVTGANKGIGRAIAQRLAETGTTVLIAARAARRGGAAAAALRAVGAHPVVLDVTAPATIEAAAAQVADRFGRLDGGAHLFEGGTSQVPLTLLESRPHGNGIVALRYARPYGHAGMMTNAPQVDVSTTLASPDWRPVTVISSDVAAELTKLKQQPGKTNSVGASGTLVRFLLTEGLLDELNLLVHPVVVGTGMRLFDEVTRQVDLTLIEARTFSTGVLAVSYQPARPCRAPPQSSRPWARAATTRSPPCWATLTGARGSGAAKLPESSCCPDRTRPADRRCGSPGRAPAWCASPASGSTGGCPSASPSATAAAGFARLIRRPNRPDVTPAPSPRGVAAGAVAVWRAGVLSAAASPGGGGVGASATRPVVREDLSATTPVAATLGYAGSWTVLGQGGGTLTWMPSRGQVISQGQALYRVDNGSPVVLLYGSVPDWRAMAEGTTGADVSPLNHDLVNLGYASSADIAAAGWDYYSAETAYGMQQLEEHLGVSAPPGSLSPGQAVFEPQAIRVAQVTGRLGGPASGPVLQATSDEHVVMIALDVSQESEVKAGDAVTVTLPDGSITPGMVSFVGTVATTAPASQQGQSPATTVPVTVTLTDPGAAGSLDQAPVTVNITTATARDTLAVPVTALLARSPGRYVVEVAGPGNTRRYMPVTPGIFDDNSGLVQSPGAATWAARRGGLVMTAAQAALVRVHGPGGVPVLELERVTKEYPVSPPVRALDRVSLAVSARELTAIVGPSGSGKSTLLHLLGTLDQPTTGTARITGLDAAAMSDRELSALRAFRIGFVFQQFFLAEHQTALGNVADGLLYAGIRRSQRRRLAVDALEAVGAGPPRPA